MIAEGASALQAQGARREDTRSIRPTSNTAIADAMASAGQVVPERGLTSRFPGSVAHLTRHHHGHLRYGGPMVVETRWSLGRGKRCHQVVFFIVADDTDAASSSAVSEPRSVAGRHPSYTYALHARCRAGGERSHVQLRASWSHFRRKAMWDLGKTQKRRSVRISHSGNNC